MSTQLFHPRLKGPPDARARFSVASTVRAYPRLPYERAKNDILGKSYVLSLVFVGSRRAQMLNRVYHKKTYVPNVLSFPLDPAHGEIFITPSVAEKEARQHGMTARGYAGFLFIHALLHLKGMQHGDTMDMLEKRYCIRYRFT